MVILQCIYTYCNSKSYRHSLNTNWNIILIKPTKAINSICAFLHASNVTVMIISSHLSHYEKTCQGFFETWLKTSEYSLMLEISDLESRGIVFM